MEELSEEVLEDYLAAAQAAGRVSLGSQGGLRRLLQVLRFEPSNPEPAPMSAAEELLSLFRRHLLDERGLSESTATAYVLRVSRFLAWSCADGNVAGLTAERRRCGGTHVQLGMNPRWQSRTSAEFVTTVPAAGSCDPRTPSGRRHRDLQASQASRASSARVVRREP